VSQKDGIMKNDQLKYQLFQELYQNYNKDLQRFIYSLTREDHFAMEEIFQNTMVQALQGLSHLRENEKMKSWIFSIAKTEAKRYYSKNNNIIQLEFNEITELEWNKTIDYTDFTKAIEDKNFVLSLMNRLTDDESQIFILHFVYNMTLKEISEILHVNNNTVRTINFRGLNKCRKMCTERGLLNER
jgi:RNA polymerase sigma-70 factor, ECF subfamily